MVAALPFGIKTTAVQWKAKTMGLAIIFVYAFFKFGWSYRLYNYVAIMVGATPPAKDKDTPEAKAHAERVGRLCEVAGRPFNRGQRAFFFALGYLGWFISLSRSRWCCGDGSSPRIPAARCSTKIEASAQKQQDRQRRADCDTKCGARPDHQLLQPELHREGVLRLDLFINGIKRSLACSNRHVERHAFPLSVPYTRSHSESFFRFVNSRTARARIHQIFVLADSSGELRN